MTRRRKPRSPERVALHGPGDRSPDGTRERSPLLVAAGALAFSIACAAAGFFVWTRYVPHAVTSVNGEPSLAWRST